MDANTGDWQDFCEIFERRNGRPLPPLERDLDYTRLPRALARSLAVFQLGESGGGSVVQQARGSGLTGIDGTYARAMELFVAEEHRHAAVLAVCVRLMGGTLLKKNWTARLFVVGRRLMGLRLKILVLLAAEVAGLSFYQLAASRLPAGRLRTCLEEIIGDERDHLRFHARFLWLQAGTPLARWAFRVVWSVVIRSSELVVRLDHRRTLGDLSIGNQEFSREWHRCRREAEAAVLAEPANGIPICV